MNVPSGYFYRINGDIYCPRCLEGRIPHGPTRQWIRRHSAFNHGSPFACYCGAIICTAPGIVSEPLSD